MTVWWQRVGKPRSGAERPTPRQWHAVARAVRRRLAESHADCRPITATDCLRVLEARASRAIGGKAYDFCEGPDRHPDRPIWEAGIFEGAFEHLLAAAERHLRAAEEARQRAERDGAEGVDPASVDDVATGVRRAGLRPPPDVVPNARPAWLDTPAELRAALRMPRRPRVD